MKNFKIFIILLFSVCSLQMSYAQKKTEYKCAYQLDMLKDTIAKKYFRKEIYIVQIGEKITKGFTYQKFYLDSLEKNNPALYRKMFNESVEKSIQAMRKTGSLEPIIHNSFHHGNFTSDLYKDYKKKEIRVVDNISIYPFVFKDELQPQKWEILSDTTTILGYHSQKAVCHYRGRNWVAWFTPEIPISEGPWKFYGLPGLITKIYDTQKHYTFELTGFQKKVEPINTKIPRKAQKITRIEFIRAKMGETESKITQGEMAKVGLSSNNNNKVEHYDYIERDYKKK